MSMLPLITVIVPIYKAEKFIHRCIDSLLKQSFTQYEILLIDDGSPDDSGIICDNYAKIDSRVKVFHKKNGGVSSARQFGLTKAEAQYVIHVDPDDWVDPDMLECLYKKAVSENADMVICDYYLNYKYKEVINYLNINDLDSDALLKDLLKQKLHGSCWNKLVRRSLFKIYNITYPEDIVCWEDLWVNCSLLMHPIHVAYLPKAFYHYDQTSNPNSIVKAISEKTVESEVKFCNFFDSLFVKLGRLDLLEALAFSKCSVKDLMFRSKLYEKQAIIDLFPDVNEFISNRKIDFEAIKNISPISLKLLLKGYSRIAYLFYNCMTVLFEYYQKFRGLIMY